MAAGGDGQSGRAVSVQQNKETLGKGSSNKSAVALAAELDSVRQEMVMVARSVQEREAALLELEQQLRSLADFEKSKFRSLNLKRLQMSRVVTILHRLSQSPDHLLLVQPTAVSDTVRTAILLRNLVPRIDEQAHSLRDEIGSLASIRADITRKRKNVVAEAEELDREHRHLALLLEHKSQLQKSTEARVDHLEKRMKTIAGEAIDLRDLLARLEKERKIQKQEEFPKAAEESSNQQIVITEEGNRVVKAQILLNEKNKKSTSTSSPVSSRPFSQAQGLVSFPVAGTVTVAFGQATGSGGESSSKGIVIKTRPNAQIIAPYDGQIMYAGQFRGYGQLLIIDHGEGYHTLLAGIENIEGNVGQKLLAGEPVGVMASGGADLLYIELRHHGQPVNPMLWFTTQNLKVKE